MSEKMQSNSYRKQGSQSKQSRPNVELRRGSVAGVALLAMILPLLVASCTRHVAVPLLRPPVQGSKVLPPRAKVPPTQRPYQIDGHTYYPLPSAYGYRGIGIASWYGPDFHGRKTSCGEVYDMYGETAAHKTLPMHTHVLVRNLENGRETVVRINDRGPFVKGRIIDLSLAAARKLDMDRKGTARVELVALGEAVPYRSDGKVEERFLPYADPNRGEFYVQVGAFTVLQNAVRLKDRLLAMERKTVIQKFNGGRTTFYRVQVRAGQKLETANRLEKEMEAAGFPGAFVIAR